ncbi:MAG: beta-glucosidase BglX [Bacteroidetes bacterium]|jgi:beta-glucosidase|nr:beta-glucosidase BglX [Bacteroidota bacterium]
MKKLMLVSVVIITMLFTSQMNEILAQSGAIDKKVDSLLAIMTLEEKIGQMNQYSSFWNPTGPIPEGSNEQMRYNHIKSGLVGSMLNVYGVENVRAVQEIAVNETRLGIPIIFGLDVVHGHRTVFPIPLAESASWDMEAIESAARYAAVEASAAGVNWTFAPMVDISRDARWGRVMEGAGEDPYLGSKIAMARVKGFQGDDLSKPNTIAATAKHLAGYGFPEAGKDYNSVDVSHSILYNVILPPFKASLDADVKSVMNAFNSLNGVPATASHFLQRDILKEDWDFQGFVLSDWASGLEMIDHGYARDLKHVAELSVIAGSDMDMESLAYVQHLEELVESGTVEMHIIDDAVRRILRVKYELGLFEDPYKYCDLQREKELIYHPDHLEAALEMAKKSIVLLKNNNDLLPLNKKQQNIAVIGALAADKNSPLGNWRIGSEDSTAISVLEGLDKYTNDYKYVKGPDFVMEETFFHSHVNINQTDTNGFAEAIQTAKNAEVVIMVLGEHGFQTGEGRSRAHIGLPGLQQELLEAVYEVNQNIVLVLMNGRPLTITWADEHIPSILETWQLGSQSGNAIAAVLFGDYNPGGKLPMTFPRSVGQIPIYYNHFSTGRPVSHNSVFWSHYTDETNSPLYPFGYGLSYTEFEYANLSLDTTNNEAIKVMVDVTNVGDVAGEEVVQLYIQDEVASLVRPVKELKGFDKINLRPGESKEVTFTLTDQELGFYNNEGEYLVEPGKFNVMVGTNSADVLKTSFIKK